MHWKDLENVLHDSRMTIPEEDVHRTTYVLLNELEESARALQGAKMAYLLALIHLKNERPELSRALSYIDHLDRLMQQEIEEYEPFYNDEAQAHVLLVRKLADQYLHHLMIVSDLRGHHDVLKKLAPIRSKNHQELLELHGISNALKEREQNLIAKAFQNHSVFAGFLVALSVFFGWTAITNLSDYALASYLYTDAKQTTSIWYYALLLIFSGSFLWGFVYYQRGRK